MDRLLGSTRTALARAWAAAIRHVRESNPIPQLADRIRYRSGPDHLLDGLGDALYAFAAAEHSTYIAAGNAESRFADTTVRKKLLNFDPSDPDVLTWAERNRLDKVTGINAEQRILIRAMLIRIEEEGTNPLEAAKDILDSIGLTPAQEAAVASYRAALEAGQYTAALQRELSSGVADGVIRRARDADRALTTEQIARAVAAYRQNALRKRAETIARTESQRIAHQGSDALYQQAVRRGDINADQVICEWLPARAGLSKHDREFHRGIAAVSWGEPFVTGLGNEMMFPGDPRAPAREVVNCRCTRTVRIRAVAEAGRRAA